MNLIDRLRPCGPVVDPVAAERLRDRLDEAAVETSWADRLRAAWPALAPIAAASPYLAGLMRRAPDVLLAVLSSDPEARLADLLDRTRALNGPPEALRAPLRKLKAELHLLTALCDLGGVWGLEAVTGALSAFADESVRRALASATHEARERGRLTSAADDPRGPAPGLFAVAMGKHGAGELNYSSDIDISLFYQPEVLVGVLAGPEPQAFANRVAQGLATLLSERTGDGYVFRVDFRLRPDPSSTPPVVAAPTALAYYESVGQNWERAAFIKARAVGGDLAEAGDFLKALTPFVWRRSLDYPAILDIQSIKKQIHVHKTGEGLQAAGANLKLGRGGIREIEFYAQTQQLILGGRDPSLRSPRTLDALNALAEAGHVPADVARQLSDAYGELRALEHRVQMLEDEQTHVLPADPSRRAAVAALAGEGDLALFDAGVEGLLAGVNHRYGELFEGGEDLSSPYGSLVFTGVENDPGTLETLQRMGFSEPASVASTIREWHHGRISATRSAKGRELFTRLAPRLLTAMAETGAPDAAFRRFAVFFSGLSGGVQVQALFLNQPRLFEMVVGMMAYAPRLARMLGRQPAALDSVLDARFLADLDEDSGVIAEMLSEAAAQDFEGAMNVVRRLHREQTFRIGLQTVTGRAGGEAAGRAYTVLADAAMRALAPAALAEAERMGGAFPGAVAVVALGKAGSREMTASSDLDLMTVYDAAPDASSAGRGWGAETFYGRFTQRLIAALSAQTAEGGLYEVDMRLRPSGSKGPVAVRLSALSDYYAREADSWEFLALTRARVVWAGDAAFGERVSQTIEAALRQPRDDAALRHDVRAMRALMDRERPPHGFWDLKLSPGGQVDAEFVAQYRQLQAAAEGRALTVSTLQSLSNDDVLEQAWRLQQRLSQLLACAFDEQPDPDAEPEGFRRRLAETAGASDFGALKDELTILRRAARAAFENALN
ncbi:bifunctional [glutamine synthetase] adenylyltransferase/[glutamine synthetase]-adenylyl-L-tyrosine phosphorylase [Brevundimonas sp. S30B]|uniref:bifunctional [glutamine synthetase] adenylyltransferase/[glutamine synthetase]-adenylyl-L-tyrosine phosphorylase n=1 Tax=unclassified Brevundimonas TaxID=2622653 RepID=UPI0010723F93|nr:MULTISPECIES: bifunctional [glutamine synthetase] adenylyltransferase/[glutamine synthetase]-adenylyl-L-tyrosine phosphorylase [unclassified Brevundimonas]QBX37109.1 bifunctional [glutamine synthetase] adenylyltransferase/[glutamine synthetase]-adenylyl-L-tyrosine phosphorylase [Brevundimonas sp. MF30-B]TFW04095.1 bifunctional [glutamine synthetase] adenylyltransferase/[glutamine synthetase]-adenylyl-L-tyrosine phosphorylase [Brevundimonas sp. S30B]